MGVGGSSEVYPAPPERKMPPVERPQANLMVRRAIPVFENCTFVNLTGEDITYVSADDNTGVFNVIHVFPSDGQAPVVISDVYATKDVLTQISMTDNSHTDINHIFEPDSRRDSDSVDEARKDNGPRTVSLQKNIHVIFRRIIPRTIHGLPPPQRGIVYILPFSVFYAAIELGRPDVTTPCGPVSMDGAVTGWTFFQEVPVRLDAVPENTVKLQPTASS